MVIITGLDKPSRRELQDNTKYAAGTVGGGSDNNDTGIKGIEI